MRRRLVVAPFLRSASVAATLSVCSVVAQAASVQTVFSAENALYGAGYNVGQADGWIDDSFRAAVRQYQTDLPNLTVTGELDAPTLNALGISGGRSQLMGGNVAASAKAARRELGLVVAVSAPEPAPKVKPKPAPEPAKPAATPDPVVEPKPVIASVPVASEPAPKPEPKKTPEPEPKQVAKTRSEPATTQTRSEPEPTSEPITIASSVRTSSRDEPAAEAPGAETMPEETVTVANVDNTEQVEESVSQEPPTSDSDQEGVSANADNESQPEDRQGNVITRMFDFLFGWMV